MTVLNEVSLSDVCEIGNGYAFKSRDFIASGIPLLRISNIDNNRVSFDKGVVYLDEVNLDHYNNFIVNKGDIVIALSGATTGKYGVYLLDTPSLLNQRIGIIRNGKSENLDSKYFYFYLSELKSEILRKAQGAAQPNISTKDIGRIKIPLPPLPEQQKIAEILDAADSLRQKDRQLIDHYTALSQSLFLDMFGDPVTNPKGFNKGTIRDLVSSVNYGTSAKSQEDGSYPYLRMNNITYEGEMDFKSLKYINLDEKDKPKFLAKRGDILFNRTNSKELVGKTGLYNEQNQMAIAGYLIRVRVNQYANPYFIWRYMNSKHGKVLLRHMCKSIVGMANINAQELQNMKILLPPLHLQNQFAERIEEIEKQKQQAQASLVKSNDLFNSLLQRAFKGELTRDMAA
jgi:type I restriction enzyme S subunit